MHWPNCKYSDQYCNFMHPENKEQEEELYASRKPKEVTKVS
jgi:hypothetical protein